MKPINFPESTDIVGGEIPPNQRPDLNWGNNLMMLTLTLTRVLPPDLGGVAVGLIAFVVGVGLLWIGGWMREHGE